MATFTYPELTQLLEVAPPLMMLDTAQVSEDGCEAVGRKAVSMGEAFFEGHFPGQPIMPGVLQVAAMAQLSRLLYLRGGHPGAGKQIVLRQLKRIKFRKPVIPGDVLTVTAKMAPGLSEDERCFQVSCASAAGVTAAGQITLATVGGDDADYGRRPVVPEESPYADKMASAERFDIVRLMELLPHRPPFLLIDRGFGVGAPGEEVWGCKNITGDDVLLRGSFSGQFPGYLLIEAGAQLGCAHVLSQPENRGKLGIFLCIDEANFHARLFPGDQLVIHACCHATGHAGIASGDFMVGSRKVADCQLKFIVAERV